MASPIFRVDLSEGARDFQPTATEPGLPMLDRQNTNYGILHRWLGDLIAEPEWQGTHVNFFLRDKARGRLENVQCYPATREDLEGPLKGELEELGNRLKKARPESSTEQLLHRIARQTFNGLTADLTQSDFDSYFVKSRSGRDPWRLAWCWGYQRTDQQPAPAYICTDPECNQLFVRRPGTKARCPACEAVVDPRRRKKGLAGPAGRRVSLAALLLLLLLAGAFFYLNRPQLIVTPAEWNGPQGSQMQFRITDKRWYFFEDDVTNRVIAQSLNPRVASFRGPGATAGARGQGETQLTFLLKDRAAVVSVRVGPPENPETLAVLPESVQLSVGATRPLRVEGTYPNGQVADLTAAAGFVSSDPETAIVYRGRIEGLREGETSIAVRYQAPASSDYVERIVPVTVRAIEFAGLEISIDPASLDLGQSGKLAVVGIDAEGARHDLLESSRLKLEVLDAEGRPAEDIARIDGEYLVARAAGEVLLHATLGELRERLAVAVSSESALPAGTFTVNPAQLDLKVGEYFQLDVLAAGGEPIEISSSDEEIVSAWGRGELAARAAGTAEITLSQGAADATVRVTVEEAEYASLRIDPADIDVRVGGVAAITVYGTTGDGDEVELAPDSLHWLKQPLSDNADFNRRTLEIVGLRPTAEPQTLTVQYGDDLNLIAEANFEVLGASAIGLVADGEFLSHPPIGLPGRTVVRAPIDLGGVYRGNVFTSDAGLVVRDFPEDSIWARAGILPGSTILGADGRLFDGVSDAELRRYLATHPLDDTSQLLVRFPDGREEIVELGRLAGRFVREVEVNYVTPRNVTPERFDVELNVNVRRAGEYRVLSPEGEPLTDFVPVGENAPTTFLVRDIPRAAAGDSYEVLIERRIGEQIRSYPLTFVLESQ